MPRGKSRSGSEGSETEPKSTTSKHSNKSGENVKIVTNATQVIATDPSQRKSRRRRNQERVEMLARPNARRLRTLWQEKCAVLPKERRDKIKSALEEDYFLTPEQTEQYFLALNETMKRRSLAGADERKAEMERKRQLQQRQKWLVDFSAQVAYRLCDYVEKGQKEMLVTNRLRSIADVVLERVAEILGEPKPSRTHPGRLARFMVAVSDRIAVWIERAVYRADALDIEDTGADDHMRLDVFFVLCFIALTSAAPQLIWPGVVAPTGLGGTVVAGPTVVNGLTAPTLGLGRIVAPGIISYGLIFFVLCFVALAVADPQVLVGPGLVAPLAPRTVVAGPTVVNGLGALGLGGVIAPGVIGVI
ncbi:uncharacterized protein LOC121735110 [Aricia agestis]|uniref:uncharacterized protein LOC121735110 n=1 Tax=Aricia agestis TaxID=91739 RepID=UPI001C2086A9|nr:uncharacterized protein LOC121735110 [Aricia agestis]